MRIECEKRPATGARGMVVTNHPVASAAGVEMLAAGGNAVDAAVAALFALTVVEPMMVGILGGGTAHVRLADGSHAIIDGQVTAPRATGPTTYAPDPRAPAGAMDALGRENAVGPTSVATPGNLMGWCETLRRFGTFSLSDVLEPAIRHAANGFVVTNYLHELVRDAAADLALDPGIAALYLPGGEPIRAGARLVTGDYAGTLRGIAREGPDLLYRGSLGDACAEHMALRGGHLTKADLEGYATVTREPVRGTYRGHEVVGPPPPASGPLHIIQMLNILEGHDVGALGFGSPETIHLLAEVLKIAFADRAAATGDPAFVDVPVELVLSKAYAAERRALIDPRAARTWSSGVAPEGSAHTTHVTTADAFGNVVASTQTINSVFGARYLVPGTGMIPNNYMFVFDPRPGRANSIAPLKRLTSSMSPVMVLRDGRVAYALGLPGGLRIFGSVMQAISNLVDHGMSLQEAVEAPRVWTQGGTLELESGAGAGLIRALGERGHDVVEVPNVGGGMGAIAFHADGMMEGAACWRADGAPIGLGGGHARRGIRFRPEVARDAPR